jgi:hypothetical protein
MARPALLLTSLLVWAIAPRVEAAAFREVRGELSIEVSATPDPPREGEWVTYTVRLQDASRAPLVGATVRLTGRMADGMAVRADLRSTRTDGIHSGGLLFTMRGRWEMRLTIAHPRGGAEVPFPEEVTGR